MNKYDAWISKHYPDAIRNHMGKCKEACLKMKEAFPELTVTNGFVVLAFIAETPTHWWCKDPDENIVDPTAYQYVWNGTPIASYEEIDDDHDERRYPKQKCMNCGDYFYIKPELNGVMHTPTCEKELMEYLNG